jgi:hypothetical protein
MAGVARDHKPLANEYRELNCTEFEFVRARAQALEQDEHVIRESFNLGRVPVTLRVTNGEVVGVETRRKNFLFGFRLAAGEVGPDDRISLLLPGCNKIFVSSLDLSTRGAVQNRAYHPGPP